MVLLLMVLGTLCASAVGLTPYTKLLDRPIPNFAQNLKGQDLADYLNLVQPFFEAEPSELSEEEQKALLMDLKYMPSDTEEGGEEINADVEIPESYDARTAWSQCKSVHLVRYQHCGNCWAVSAASTMSDRLCMQSNGTIQKMISDVDITYCCGWCGGCRGGWPAKAFIYTTNNGTCSGGPYREEGVCKPYFGPNVPVDRSCKKECIKGSNITYDSDKIYAKRTYRIASNVKSIQKEILLNGPVQTMFFVYSDWAQYKKGIYVHTGGQMQGGHAGKIIGWGVENDIPYWIIANSYGPRFGEQGHFRIIRGRNEVGIETWVFGVQMV